MKNLRFILSSTLLTSVFLGQSPSEAAAFEFGKSYRVVSTCGSGDRVISISGASKSNDAPAVIALKNTADASQIFKLLSVGSAIKFVAQHSGKVLDVAATSKVNGASVIQYTDENGANQLFTVKNVTSGVYKFQNVNSGLFLDVKGESIKEGNPLNQYSSNTSCAQRFKLEEVAPPAIIWTTCALEDETCSFSGTREVRYGANNVFVTKTINGSTLCTNSVFTDPAPGIDKLCQYSSEIIQAPTPTPPAGGSLLTDSIFAPTSFWYQPIPTNVALHPKSAEMAKDLVRQKETYYGNVSMDPYSFTSPVYFATSSTPKVKVAQWDCQNKGYLDESLAAQFAAVPIPAYARPSGGTDGEMTVYDPTTDTIYEFWQMRKNGTQWEACWGGRMLNAKSNQGIFDGHFGTTATSLPFLGGQVTAEELQRGEIRHAIGIAIVDIAAWNIFSWPAQRSDGNGRGIIAEGQRFRLDPTINVDALNISPVAKIVAKAAQKYGFVVWDFSGSLSIRVENYMSYTSIGIPDPYEVLYGNKQGWQILDGIPWDKMQFLPMDYGRP